MDYNEIDLLVILYYLDEVNLTDRIRLKMLEFRQKEGLLQREFAKKTNIPTTIISNLENGKTEWSLSRIEQVCAAFNLSPSNFFQDFPDPGMEEISKGLFDLPMEKWEKFFEKLKLTIEIDLDTMKKRIFLRNRELETSQVITLGESKGKEGDKVP